MSTPLKALIQERLRAKIVRQEVDGDDITDGIDDFAAMDREIDLQSPSRLLMHHQQHQQQSKQPGRRARRGSVDARGASAVHRPPRQPLTQDDHAVPDAAPSHRRQHKHHSSNGSRREKQQHGHSERRRHHHHHHHSHHQHHHGSSGNNNQAHEEEEQTQQQQLGSTGSETILDHYAYDHSQKFGSYFDRSTSAYVYNERYTPQQQQHEADVDKRREHFAQAASPWEHHQQTLANQFDAPMDQSQQLQTGEPHRLSLMSPRFAHLQSSSRAQQSQHQHQQYGRSMSLDSNLQPYSHNHDRRDTRVHPVTTGLSGGDYLPLQSPHTFAAGSNMHELLRESTALIPAEAYEAGFSHLASDQFEYAHEQFETQTLDSASRKEERLASPDDRYIEHASRKRRAAALDEAHDSADIDGAYRQQRQRLLYSNESKQRTTDKSDANAPDQAQRTGHHHEQLQYFHHDSHAQHPQTQRFGHGAPLHVDMLSSPLAAASSLAPLVFAAATSPRLETKHGGKSARYRHQSYALEALTSPLASALGVLPAPLDMAAVESNERRGDDGDTSASFCNDNNTSELLSRRPAGPLLRRLNATTLSPGCRRAATVRPRYASSVRLQLLSYEYLLLCVCD